MKAYLVEVLVLDFKEVGIEGIRSQIGDMKYLEADAKSIKFADIGEWTDDHPLNDRDLCEAYYNKLFHI